MTASGLKRLTVLVCAVSLAGATWIAVRVFVFPAKDRGLPPEQGQAPAPAPQPSKPAATAELSRAILDNDVFGLKPLPGTADKAKEPPKPAEIDMELAGTVVSASGRHSVAFLRDKSSKAQKPYGIGAAVKDARIKSIGKNFVILERQGREEILTMKP
ncbi:type II secretion system protein N [Solidesulfovibrio sp.]